MIKFLKHNKKNIQQLRQFASAQKVEAQEPIDLDAALAQGEYIQSSEKASNHSNIDSLFA